MKQRHVRRLTEGKCTIELGFILSDVSTNFERVSDHCSNIAISLMETRDVQMDAHAYVMALKEEGKKGNAEFSEMVVAYRKMYELP